MKETGSILRVAGIYSATVIGAGFASGQEIARFFTAYNKGGAYGILFSGVLFAAVGSIVLDRVYRDHIRNYDEFIFPALGWGIGWAVEIAVTLYMFSVLCIMTAGSGRIIANTFGISFRAGAAFSAAIFMVLILTSIKGIVFLSSIVTPLMVAGIVIVGFYTIAFKDAAVFGVGIHLKSMTDNWFFSSILYAGYNSLTSIVVMCGLLPYLKTRRTGIAGGALGGILLCLMALLIHFALFIHSSVPVKQEFPFLDVAGRHSSLLSSLYSLVLWLAMLVSGVTAGYGFVDRLGSKTRIDRRWLAPVACAIVIPLSGIGFSGLIAALYPFFGYIGMFLVFSVFLLEIKECVQRR